MAIPINTCNRCGHEWAQRRGRPAPRTCPSCKSPYWSKERVFEQIEVVGEDGAVKARWKRIG